MCTPVPVSCGDMMLVLYVDGVCLTEMALQRGVLSGVAPSSVQSTASDAAASQLFDEFCSANTFHSIMDAFRRLSDVLELRPDRGPTLRQLKVGLSTSWKAQSLWTKLDKRMSHWEYKRGTACTNTRVCLIISYISTDFIGGGGDSGFYPPKSLGSIPLFSSLPSFTSPLPCLISRLLKSS